MADTATTIVNSKELLALSNNLNKLMFTKNIDTKTLHLTTNISISAINALKRGTGNPTLGTLLELAKYFNTSIDKLIDYEKENNASTNHITIPLFDMTHVEKRTKEHAIDYLTTDSNYNDQNNLFATTLHNNSLSPFFDKGSIFILSPSLAYTDGDIILIRLNNDHYCYRKAYNRDIHTEFQYISMDPKPHVYNTYKLIGTVVKVIQPLR